MRPLWTQTVSAPLRGLCLARERDWVLAWDGLDALFLFNHAGALQSQRPSPVSVAKVCCADDGSTFAIGGSQSPVVCLLATDLSPRWQRTLPQRATAIALEPLGRFVAVADAGCTLHVFDWGGRLVWRATTPRPLCHLTFVPEKPILVGAADFGLVVCFDAAGGCLWRDGLVAHIGSLAVSGDGGCLLLACFSDGLYRYSVAGPQPQRVPREMPCHFAGVSYSGDCWLTADRDNRLRLLGADGTVRDQINLDAAPAALAAGALGDYAVVGLADGKIVRVDARADSPIQTPKDARP